MKVIDTIGKFCGKYMALLTIVFAAAAFLFTDFFKSLASVSVNTQALFGSHMASLSLTNILLGVIMFGMGMTLKADDFKEIVKRPKDVIIGIFSQYIVMSGLAFLLAKIFALDAETAIGLILLGCVPGGTASNVMTFLAKGDVPLSVTITMCTTILATLLTPALTYALGSQWVEVDFLNMFLSVVLVVALPIVLGIVVHTLIGDKAEKIKSLLVLVSTLSIVLIVAMCVAPNTNQLLQTSSLLIMFIVLLHHVLGLAAGYGISKLFKFNDAKTRALTLEVGLQNSGLAVGLASAYGSLAALPCVLATVIHQIVGALVANFFARKEPDAKQKSQQNEQQIPQEKLSFNK